MGGWRRVLRQACLGMLVRLGRGVKKRLPRNRRSLTLLAKPNDASGTAMENGSSQNVPNHVAVHVRQATLNPVVVEGQPLVVEPQQVQHRRVQVMH